MGVTNRRSLAVLVTFAVLAGTLVAGLLALVTFGAQATAKPEGLPVAVAVPDSGRGADALAIAAQQMAGQGGGRLAWRVTTLDAARMLLHDKEVYGVLELTAGPSGPQATVVTSGAITPSGTQIAQQALTGAGQAVTAAIVSRSPGLQAAPVRELQLHPASPAGRTAPLAITALAWIGALVAGIALTVLADRRGVRVGAGGRLAVSAAVSVVVTALIAGYLRLWDATLAVDAEILGLILFTVAAFAAVQGGLLHVLGVRAVALLAPLYLIAPAVAAQVPELLHPGYRAALWSWTPFRFPAEALRSLLQATPDAPDVALAWWVLGGLLVVGVLLLTVPSRKPQREVVPGDPAKVLSGA